VITLKPASRTFAERLLVVGTAAGQVKPLTGGGIYYGLLCADIAAAVLDKALEADDFSPKALSAYETSWHSLLRQELATAWRARATYEHLSDGLVSRLIDAFASSGGLERALQSEAVSFDWHGRALRHLLSLSSLAKLVKGL
jgi:flavin-dependent dehydrogenase